jgi:hypothetical protein
MELLTPQAGLLFWTLIAMINLLLAIYVISRILKTNSLTDTSKLTWFFIVFLVPFAGSFIFLGSFAKKQNANSPLQ